MKVYSIYLDGLPGWVAKTAEEITDEVKDNYIEANVPEEELDNKIQDVINQISALKVGETYTVDIGGWQWKYECDEMTEEVYNSLGEFMGW